MQMKELFKMQKALDHYIQDKHQLQNEDLFNRKVLALLVEIGELANETRSFKFWSVKPSSEKEVILEEFVDGVHFILSLGIECGFDEQVFDLETIPSPFNINEQFIEVYQAVCTFQQDRQLSRYHHVFQAYLQLAMLLGIKQEEMEQAYIKKNEVNYKRQLNNY